MRIKISVNLYVSGLFLCQKIIKVRLKFIDILNTDLKIQGEIEKLNQQKYLI